MNNPLLQKGIEAAKSGQKREALRYFQQVLAIEPGNIPAWLWLASVLEDRSKQIECMNRVLQLDPANPAARKALEQFRQQASQPEPPPRTAADPVPEVKPVPQAAFSANLPKNDQQEGVGAKPAVQNNLTYLIIALIVAALVILTAVAWGGIKLAQYAGILKPSGINITNPANDGNPFFGRQTAPIVTVTPPENSVEGFWLSPSNAIEYARENGEFPGDSMFIEFLKDGSVRMNFNLAYSNNDPNLKSTYKIVDGKTIVFENFDLQFARIESLSGSEMTLNFEDRESTFFTRLPIYKDLADHLQGVWEISNRNGQLGSMQFAENGQILSSELIQNLNYTQSDPTTPTMTYQVENGIPFLTYTDGTNTSKVPMPIVSLSEGNMEMFWGLSEIVQAARVPLQTSYSRNIIGSWGCTDGVKVWITDLDFQIQYYDNQQATRPYHTYGQVGLIFDGGRLIVGNRELAALVLLAKTENEISIPDLQLSCFRE